MMTRSQRAQVLPILLLLISLMILLLTAWVSDDAFITLVANPCWMGINLGISLLWTDMEYQEPC
ncbi:MAG: hypothetical protein U0X93_00295 [Anaerolineales bacterium]